MSLQRGSNENCDSGASIQTQLHKEDRPEPRCGALHTRTCISKKDDKTKNERTVFSANGVENMIVTGKDAGILLYAV